MTEPLSKNVEAPNGTVAGILLIACGILSVAVVSHHPVARGPSHGALFRQIAGLSTMDELVHGTLIAFMLALAYATTVFALRRGLRDQTAVAGLLCYLIGIVAVLGAALTDGFFTPLLGAAALGGPAAAIPEATELLVGAFIVIQVLTKFAIAVMSLAILIWSIGLAGAPGPARIVSAAGAAASLIPLAMLAFAMRTLDPRSLELLLVLQAVWYVSLGALLIRKEI